jgi:hypothetical protein
MCVKPLKPFAGRLTNVSVRIVLDNLHQQFFVLFFHDRSLPDVRVGSSDFWQKKIANLHDFITSLSL